MACVERSQKLEKLRTSTARLISSSYKRSRTKRTPASPHCNIMLASSALGRQRCAQPNTQREFNRGAVSARPARAGRRNGLQPVNSLGLGLSSSSTAQIGVLSNVASATIVALGALWWAQQRRSEVSYQLFMFDVCLPTAVERAPRRRHTDSNISAADHGRRSRVSDVRGHGLYRVHLPQMERWRCRLQQLRRHRQVCLPHA